MHKSYLSFNLMPPLRLHHKLWVNSVSFRRAICIHLASIKHSNKNSSDCYRDDLIQLCNLLQCMFYLKGKQGRRVRGLRLQWAILQEDITWWLLANSSCSSFLWSQAGGVFSSLSPHHSSLITTFISLPDAPNRNNGRVAPALGMRHLSFQWHKDNTASDRPFAKSKG